MIISELELSEIKGGNKYVIGGLIASILAFLIGMAEGLTKPLTI